MPPPTTDPTWPPASARQVATTLVASLQQATTSARLLLLACFQCQALKPGCLRRQDEQDGAWFDCDKLQVEHPYCYVNPVALHEAAPTSSLSSTPTQPARTHLPSITRQPTDTHQESRTQQPSLAHQNSITQQPLRTQKSSFTHPPSRTHQPTCVKASEPFHRNHKSTSQHEFVPRRSSSSPTLSTRGLSSTVSPNLLRKHSDRFLVNGRTRLSQDMDHRAIISLEEGTMIKKDVVGYTNCDFRSPLVESFAAKLEADLKKLEYDQQRAEGEVVRVRELREDELTIKDDVDFFEDGTSDIPFSCEGFEAEVQPEGEVWEPSELEDAFECYNMAAFYSYGNTFPVTDKFSSKLRGEKYEEVFPVTFHNNNTIKVFKPASESESPLPITPKEECTIENVQETGSTKENCVVSQEQLKSFIDSCIVTNTAEKLNISYHENTNNDLVRDRCIRIDGKSFNKMLIFNLVKSLMSESVNHPHLLPSCRKYPTHIVQNRVLAILLEENDIGHVNPSGLQVFRNSSLLSATENESYQHQLYAKKLVDEVVASEVRAEDRHWKNFSREESELKEAISTELFDDLISDTTNLFASLLRQKMTM